MAKKSDAPKPDFNPDEARTGPVYHGSNLVDPEEFMRAPLLHVGTQDQANQLIENPESRFDEPNARWPIGRSFPGVHKLQFSQFAEFHPRVMDDEYVNIAHGLLLQKNKMGWGDSNSAIPEHFKDMESHPEVQEALQAFESNKIVPYHNVWETPIDKMGNPRQDTKPSDHISYAVPSPRLNLKRGNRRDPQQQPVLPMDYSGTSDTDLSNRAREEFKNPPQQQNIMHFFNPKGR